ncbi:hypothetical protein V6N11_072799 [Hibiscus sabdariffa]|uniref:PORR domain-containing protein n=1 Tax=Hibiscus sabdariffa TaxID=183260 RepID=A0ABR2A5T8_9ROSI
MEPLLLLASNKASISTSFPLFLSYKSSFHGKPKPSTKSHFQPSNKVSEKTPFLGQSLVFQDKGFTSLGNLRKTHVPYEPVRAAVKRRKELPFDSVIQRDKKLKLVLKIRKILVSQPDRIMSLRSLGRYRRDLGLDKRRRFIALLRKFPGVFEIMEEGAFSLRFRLTPEAEKLYLDELRVRNEMKRYPQYFRVVQTERGPALELTHWDPELAVSAAELAEEENRARELEEKNLIIDRPLKFNRIKLPKGLNLSKEKEKHACAVVHEMLSLTVEKRTLVDHLTHFREEFRFSQQLRGMIIRHPDMFYVSLKGDRDSVFLREAYRDSQLIDKDPLLLIKEKFRSLVAIPRFPKRGSLKKDDDGNDETDILEEASDEEGEVWSDMDSYLSDGGFDDARGGKDGDDYEDDWSDEEEDDDAPPDFDEDDEAVNVGLSKQTAFSAKKEENHLPVFPDGRPRERW